MIYSLLMVPVTQANFFSGPEILVVFLIVLLLFGGKKLPEVARSLGQGLRAFKDEANKLQGEISLEETKATAAKNSASAATEAPVDVKPEAEDEAEAEKEAEKVQQQ